MFSFWAYIGRVPANFSLTHCAQLKREICRVMVQVTGVSNREEEASKKAALVPFLLEDRLVKVWLPQ